MKVLIIHHLEPIWQKGYGGFGESFESLQEKFLAYLSENSFQRVILTRFEDWRACSSEGYFSELLDLISEVRDYAYGWEAEMFQDESDYCEGGTHSEVVYLPEWLKQLKKRGAQVTLTGAFEGECIEDMEIALSHLEIPFTKARSLIL